MISGQGGTAAFPQAGLQRNVKSIVNQTTIETIATRCHILKLKCTKFHFGLGSTPDPSVGAYSAPTDSLAGFKGPTSKGRDGRKNGRDEQGRRREESRGIEGRIGERRKERGGEGKRGRGG